MTCALNLRAIAGLFALCVLSLSQAQADVFRSGDFRLVSGEAENAYEFFVDAPTESLTSFDVQWPEGCVQNSFERLSVDARMRVLYRIECETRLAPGAAIRTPWRLDGAEFYTNIAGAAEKTSLIGTRGGIEAVVAPPETARRGLGEIAAQFLWQGVLHIWFGWDHLAFVSCLCMIAQGRRLLELVTLFTLGHSVSLGLSFFEVIAVPIPPVEAVIALSIALLARDALVKGPNAARDAGLLRYAVIVGAFGLIHGLGFASALGELGVPRAERWPALVFFNIGIELGQVAFIAALSALMLGLRSVSADMAVRRVALYGVGVIGAFWTVERIWGFGAA
jgi:hypothetical protein